MQINEIDDTPMLQQMGYGDTGRTLDVLHLSDVIKALMRKLQPGRFSKGPFVMNERVETGILFESMLEEALAKKYATYRPGEFISDEGIYMSPDGVNIELMAGEEYKATWMSSRAGLVDDQGAPLDKFFHWFVQMMGYAKHLGVNKFLLRVLFVNGNYNRSGVLKDGSEDPDSGPTFKSYRIEFTDAEIEENWQMLLTVAREEGMLT